jgi:hypothetical protein
MKWPAFGDAFVAIIRIYGVDVQTFDRFTAGSKLASVFVAGLLFPMLFECDESVASRTLM